MKQFLKPFLVPFLLIAFFVIGMFIGFRIGIKEKEYKQNNYLVDSLKAIINDNRNIAKLDTIYIEGVHTIDTIKIYYKIKQNEAKNDTSAIAIYDRFENLLSKNRNRADKRSK